MEEEIGLPAEDLASLRGRVLPVHTHGTVCLVDALGGDRAIVDAARVSYGGAARRVRDDAALLDYLLRHGHSSPFEMCELVYHIKAPIFVERQVFRHRTAAVNSVSGRYSVLAEELYVPAAFAGQDRVNRQGSDGPPDAPQEALAATMRAAQEQAYAAYRRLLEAGVSREQARLVLPVSLYTEWVWKVDLRNCFHFLGLRLDAHAQAETRDYARQIARGARAVAPLAYAAFEEHVLGAATFSRGELALLRRLAGGEPPATALAAPGLPPGRRRELAAKLGLAALPDPPA